MTITSLTASLPADGQLQLAAHLEDVDGQRRTVFGMLIPPAGARANTSAGPTTFLPGSVTWAADLRRVKLLREHQSTDSLGYAVELDARPDGSLWGRFYLPPGPTQDRALVEAANGIRDGFSVGVTELEATSTDGLLTVSGAVLRECSLCSVPAFDDSRVLSVIATSPTTGRIALMLCNSCGQHHAPGTPCAPTQVQAAAPAPAPVNVQGVDVQQLVAELRELLAGSVQSVPTTPIPPGPASPSGQQAGGPRELSLSEFCQMAVDAQTGRAELPRELRAALSDVVPADSGTGAQGGAFFRPAYLDELWDQSTYVRRFIDNAVTVRPLPRALQVTGFRWVEKPAMADYAGNKTAVPSNPVSLEPVTVPVTRSAGAHDVDRAYIDLGSPDFLAAYFEAQTDSYRQLSDGKAATVAWNGAAVLGDGAGVTTGVATDVLAAVVALVVELSNIGEGVEYIALAPGLISQLLGITDDTAPAFFQGSFQLGNMGDGNLGGLRFFTTPALPAAGLLGGTRAATFWHELATPIRVQAENIANGGVDLGVFGYHAGYVRNSRQIRKVTVTV